MKREHSLRTHGSLGVMLAANLPNFQHTEQGPAGGLFHESMPLGGMCICRGARAHSEHPGDFTGVCTASRAWSGVSSSGFLQLSMSLCLPEREGAQEQEEMRGVGFG